LNKNYKSKLLYYIIIWLAAITMLFFMKFTILRNATGNILFNTFIIFGAITWISVMIIRCYESIKINNYMWKYHKNYWDQRTNMEFQINIMTKIRRLKNNNLNDPILEKIMLNFKKLFIFNVIVFFTYPFIFIIIMTPLF
jgi:hypothetical protein